ncbi:alpha/beta hydrolase, partial [Candidatus Omnitrophota bacterium]
VSPQELRPEDSIKNFHNPLLVIAGSHDRHTPLHESKRLFDNADEPKELWVIEGAGHENFHAFSPKEYEKKILNFFSEHLTSNN